MKLAIPLLIASLTLPVGAVGTSRPQGTAITLNTSGASPSTSGIVAAVRNTEVYIRSANNRLTPLHVPTGTRVVTSDGYRLAAADIQLGDRLSVRGRGEIVDLSQQVRQMTGIVSDVPDPSGDVVIVNARRVGPVVAEIRPEVG
jgi:hypothetical protein